MKEIATRDVYGDVLVKLGKENPNIVVLDADLSASTRTKKFAQAFPDRFFNMGIAEQDMMSTAAGLAAAGKLPFVSTFAAFATGRCWDQIRQSICYSNQNVKIVATHAGITVGEDSAMHQANEDIALMRSLPNMTVIVPADGIETEKALEFMLHDKSPTYLRLSRCKTPVIFDESYVFNKSRATILKDGFDATIIATGSMVSKALEASQILNRKGILVRVLNVSTLKPLDHEAVLAAAKETEFIITVEEHSIIGGLGSAVLESLSETDLTLVKRIGINDCFGQSGSPNELLSFYDLTAENIVEVFCNLLSDKIKGLMLTDLKS